MRADGELIDALTHHFSAKMPEIDGLAITSFRRSSQGWSDDTLVLTVGGTKDGEPVSRSLAVRCHKTGGTLRTEYDLTRHYRVLEALARTDIPAPRALWLERDPAVSGTEFMVMEGLDGYAPQLWSPEGEQFLAELRESEAVQEEFVGILARIHTLDWRAAGFEFLEVPPPGKAFALQQVAKYEQMLVDFRTEPEPVIVDALGWLRHHAPPADPLCFIHSDYRTGNILYHEQKTIAVIDWELAAIGDPYFDLGWVCARANRLDSPYVCHLMDREKFLRRYSELTGRPVDFERLRYYEALLLVRNAATFFTAGHSFAHGETDDLRLARAGEMLPLVRHFLAELLGY